MSEQSLDVLIETHGAALLRFAYLLCRDAAQAEDLVQEALIKALHRWRDHGEAAHPVAYLRKIVVNEYLGWRRRRASTEVVTDLTADRSPQWTPVADPADAHADRTLMWQLLGTLPPRSRAVLVLRYYEALPDSEIAAHLGCAEATVRSIAARAFATLRSDPYLASLAPAVRLTKEA